MAVPTDRDLLEAESHLARLIASVAGPAFARMKPERRTRIVELARQLCTLLLDSEEG